MSEELEGDALQNRVHFGVVILEILQPAAKDLAAQLVGVHVHISLMF
jgi:hypothetical protein